MNRRALAIIAAAVLVVCVIAWRVTRRDASPPTATEPRDGMAASVPTAPGDASRPSRVRRVSATERAELARQIDRARAGRAAAASMAATTTTTTTTAPPSRPDRAPSDLEHTSAPLREGLEEAIPLLAACFPAEVARDSAARTAAVTMTLKGDPSIGTVIDADQMLDRDQHPLPPTIDACLRTTISELALPPLDEGDLLHIQYSFRFDD